MDDTRRLLRHFLAALAYRTQKALRDAPSSFAAFRAGDKTRTPHELVRHMTSVLGYASTFFTGGKYRPEPLPTFDDEVRRFHEVLADLSAHLERGTPLIDIAPERLLQGPPENFVFARISAENLGPDQPPPARPDKGWPEAP